MGAAAAVEPQARDRARRELRGRPPVRHGAQRGGRRRAVTRVRGDVNGARQRGPQLRRGDRGRVAADGQGAPHRVLRRRSATRSAPAAPAARSCSSRWRTPIPASTRASCRSAASRTPGPRASSWPTTSWCATTSRTRRSGRRAWPGRRSAIAAVEGHPNHANSIELSTLYFESLGDPSYACAGVSASERYDAQTNPDGVRCDLADYMVNVFGKRPSRRLRRPAARQRGRAVRARRAQGGEDHAGPVRGPEREGGRRGHRRPVAAAARRGRPAGARATPTAAARSTRRTT